jgi:hypothetical protein
VQNQNPEITIPVPIYVKVSKKNTFSINLNEYRNAHFHVLNKAKIVFSQMIAPVLATIPPMVSTKLHFKLFFGSNRDVDTSNVCSIVEKFFCDAIVDHGILEDDNRRFLIGSTSEFGGVDTKNPRVEVTFFDYILKPKEQKPMRLILSQHEIAAVLINHFLPLLSGGEEKRGEFTLASDADGKPVGVLDILHPASAPETPVETPVATKAPTPAPKATKPRAAAPAASPKTVTPVTLVATAEGVAAVPVEAPSQPDEEGQDDRGDIFDLTPRTTAIEIENDAQDAAADAAEAASHEDQAADAGTKEETDEVEEAPPVKPALTLFPKGDTPKPVESPAAAPVDRRGLFAAQNGPKPSEKPAPKAGTNPVGTLFSGLAKPKHQPTN